MTDDHTDGPENRIPGVTFNLSSITVAQWAAFAEATIPRGKSGEHDAWCEMLARTVTALPKGWGGRVADEKTYRNMRQFDQFEPLQDAFMKAIDLVKKNWEPIEGVKFDLMAITVEEWAAHNDAISIQLGKTLGDLFNHWWAFFPKVITKKPDTLIFSSDEMSYAEQFTPLMNMFAEAVSETRKKVSG